MFKTILLALCASAILAAQNDELLILLKGASALAFYTPEGREIARTAVREHPHEMILAPEGRLLYTTDNGTMRIEQAGVGGNFVSIVDIQARKKVGEIDLGKFRRPHGIDIGPSDGLIYIVDGVTTQVHVFDPVTFLELNANWRAPDPEDKIVDIEFRRFDQPTPVKPVTWSKVKTLFQ